MTGTTDSLYFLADPYREVTFLEAPEVPTVVNTVADHPMSEMAEVFDSTFTALFPSLGTQGIQPVGPAFSLHTRMPAETVDMEVGVPVDRPLTEAISTDSGVTLRPSKLPSGRIAIMSYFGPYDGIGAGWERLMQSIADAGHQPGLPLWEIYTTEPSPDIDPATLRTDLVVLTV
ncbi:GyrI-like domain-containing protein [Citricoccus sp. GCM10030269]|uniref:GyrI-like domain-containing protein n=1 Tax=Citricoccus sp. GCM10030269 TaxID=3273388 RepID=UPI0036121955